jgi:hypothetical protein
MGADIHMFVEYRKKRAQELKNEGKKPYWYSYGDHTNPGRNYTLFGVLAGVRGQYEDSFEPKGKLPKDEMGFSSQYDAWLTIAHVNDVDVCEGYVKLEDAKKYESYGRQILNDEEGMPRWVEHPDWHSHSWMSIDELEEAFKRYTVHASAEWGEEITKPPVEYRALLASMKALEDDGENEVRVVFWFDN